MVTGPAGRSLNFIFKMTPCAKMAVRTPAFVPVLQTSSNVNDQRRERRLVPLQAAFFRQSPTQPFCSPFIAEFSHMAIQAGGCGLLFWINALLHNGFLLLRENSRENGMYLAVTILGFSSLQNDFFLCILIF